jgi:hypothetical protein
MIGVLAVALQASLPFDVFAVCLAIISMITCTGQILAERLHGKTSHALACANATINHQADVTANTAEVSEINDRTIPASNPWPPYTTLTFTGSTQTRRL